MKNRERERAKKKSEGDMTGSELRCGNYDFAIATETDISIELYKKKIINVLEIYQFDHNEN